MNVDPKAAGDLELMKNGAPEDFAARFVSPEAAKRVAASGLAYTDAYKIVQGMLKEGLAGEAARWAASSTDWTVTPVAHRRKITAVYAAAGMHRQALDLGEPTLREMKQTDTPEKEIVRFSAALGVSEMFATANEFLDLTEQPSEPRGFALIYNVANPVLPGLMVPIASSLMKQGYAVGAAVQGTLAKRPVEIAEFDDLQGSVGSDGFSFRGAVAGPDAFLHDWKIAWSEKTVEAGGVNFFAPFHERVSQKARRYRTDDLDDPKDKATFDIILRQSDVALAFCEALLPLARRGLPIRIIAMDVHFAPWGVLREWCAKIGRDLDIHTVSCSASYQNYFSNLTTSISTNLSVEDLTAQPTLRAPFLGGRHRFQRFLKERPEAYAAADDEVLSWIRQDRSKTQDAGGVSRQSALDRIEQAKTGGRPVFMLAGKVSIDFAAPGDRGHVFATYTDWLTGVMRIVSGTGALMLIKPHPHELREEIVVGGAQLMRDLLPVELPEEALFLDHSDFNTHDLVDHLDAVFIWNGTTSVELPAQGVPVICESIWAQHDYPVDNEILTSGEDYRRVLSGDRKLSVAPETRRLSASFLRFMKSDDVSIPFRYIKRAAYNKYAGPIVLYKEDLDRYATQGDAYVDKAASRVFEFAGRAKRKPAGSES